MPKKKAVKNIMKNIEEVLQENVEEVMSVKTEQESIEIELPEVFDIDENVIRSSTKHQRLNQEQTSVSVKNSRIFDVLEETFTRSFPKAFELPNFNLLTPQKCIELLGKHLGCDNHETNFVSFWILDILSEVIRQAQINGVKNENLKTICYWFYQLLKLIKTHAPTKEEFFYNLNEMLFEVEKDYEKTGLITHPTEIFTRLNIKTSIDYNISLTDLTFLRNDLLLSKTNSAESISTDFKLLPVKEDEIEMQIQNYQDRGDGQLDRKNMTEDDCTKLNEIEFLARHVFEIFGNKFKYEVIKSVFSCPPEITPVTILENINFPKSLGLPLNKFHEIYLKKRESARMANNKVTTIEDPMKAKKKKADMTDKKKKGKQTGKEEVANITAVDRFKNEMQQLDCDREEKVEFQRTKHDFIRPLEDSVTDQFFERLFPKRISLPEIKQTVKEMKANRKKNN